jgi:hypothetical protein
MPRVAKTFALDEIPAALECLEQRSSAWRGRHQGPLTVTRWADEPGESSATFAYAARQTGIASKFIGSVQ